MTPNQDYSNKFYKPPRKFYENLKKYSEKSFQALEEICSDIKSLRRTTNKIWDYLHECNLKPAYNEISDLDDVPWDVLGDDMHE